MTRRRGRCRPSSRSRRGCYAILTGPSGDSIPNAIAVKQGAGLDSYSAKLMFGDWVYWSDPVAGTVRLVSPQGFVAGRLANLSPEQSSLNKPLYGVVGTQRAGTPGSGGTTGYSTAELTALLGGGLDVIANPQPGGAFWGVRGGHNSSSNAATNGDNYTRLTNYIAATLVGRHGPVCGAGDQRRAVPAHPAHAAQLPAGFAWPGHPGQHGWAASRSSVICDSSNNPPSRTGLGYVQSDAQIQYQAINERFIVNLEGGQTVQVTRQTLPSGQVGGGLVS